MRCESCEGELLEDHEKLLAEIRALKLQVDLLQAGHKICHEERNAALLQVGELKELFRLAAPMLDAYDDGLHRVRFTELHKLSDRTK